MDEERRESCPAERNFGRPCLYPNIRGIFLSCGRPCSSAGVCNASANFAAPYQHIPSEEKVREVCRRLALCEVRA